MIVDNADDINDYFPRPLDSFATDDKKLGQYLPECSHGKLLITTRDKKVGVRLPGSNPLNVTAMALKDCRAFLQKQLAHLESADSDLTSLVDKLECLPLALAQAVAFIQEKCCTVPQYLKLQRESDNTLVELLGEDFMAVGQDPGAYASRAVASTWMVLFQQIKLQDALSAELLSVMSMLDRQGIPRKLLSQYAQTDSLRLVRALGILKAFSLVAENKGGNFDMHRLVQLVTRKWLLKHNEFDPFRERCLVLVSAVFPCGRMYEHREACHAYLSHARSVLELEGPTKTRHYQGEFGKAKANLLHSMAGLSQLEVNLTDAEELETSAIEVGKSALGSNDELTLAMMNCLADIYFSQGRFRDSLTLIAQVTSLSFDLFGWRHATFDSSFRTLRAVLRGLGESRFCEKEELRVLEVQKKALGLEHETTLISMNKLASTYGTQGRYAESEALDAQVLETRKRMLGADHPDTLISMNNLATTYLKLKRYEEGERLLIQATKMSKARLGEDHPLTLNYGRSLAGAYWETGKRSRAIELVRECLRLLQIKLGAEHAATKESAALLKHMELLEARHTTSTPG